MNRQVINNHRILNRPNSNNVTEEDNNTIGEALVKDEPVWDNNDNYSSSLKRRIVVENDPKQNRKDSSSAVKYIIRSNPTNSNYRLVEPSRVVVTQSRQTPNLSLPIQQPNRTRNDMNLIEEMIGRKNPAEIKSRLRGLFAQIEKEVDSLCDDYNRLYEENARLKAQINSSASAAMFLDHQNEYLIKILSF